MDTCMWLVRLRSHTTSLACVRSVRVYIAPPLEYHSHGCEMWRGANFLQEVYVILHIFPEGLGLSAWIATRTPAGHACYTCISEFDERN